MDDAAPGAPAPSTASGIMLGLGFGGLLDGILMHQVLQWHHLVSSQEPPDSLGGLQLNTFADGLFHAASLLLVVGGVVVLLAHWRQGRLARSWAHHGGVVVAGVGLFNIADSLVNHWLLGTHHVRDDLGGPLAWDVGFLVLSVALTGLGWMVYRRAGRGGSAAGARIA